MRKSLRLAHVRNATSRRALATLALVGVLGLTGCGGSSLMKLTPANSATSTAVGSTAPAATPAPALLGEIVWASVIDPATSAPVNTAASFRMDAVAIYAVVPVKNVTPGLTVTADWTFNGSALPGVASTVVATQSIVDGWIEFRLTLPSGQIWPAGIYHIDVRQPVGGSVHADIRVKLPTS